MKSKDTEKDALKFILRKIKHLANQLNEIVAYIDKVLRQGHTPWGVGFLFNLLLKFLPMFDTTNNLPMH